MAKGKRTYIWYYSTTTWDLVHVTNVQKKNFTWDKKWPNLTKYNKKIQKRESLAEWTLKVKEIKKG